MTDAQQGESGKTKGKRVRKQQPQVAPVEIKYDDKATWANAQPGREAAAQYEVLRAVTFVIANAA